MAEKTTSGRVRAAVDTVRMRALPATQNRLAEDILAGKVFYRPNTATWFLSPAEGVVDSGPRAERGDGRALRTMRAGELIRVCDEETPDSRGAYPVVMTDRGHERYRIR